MKCTSSAVHWMFGSITRTAVWASQFLYHQFKTGLVDECEIKDCCFDKTIWTKCIGLRKKSWILALGGYFLVVLMGRYSIGNLVTYIVCMYGVTNWFFSELLTNQKRISTWCHCKWSLLKSFSLCKATCTNLTCILLYVHFNSLVFKKCSMS